MSLSPDVPVRSYVIRGSDCVSRPARLNAKLVDNELVEQSVRQGSIDSRLVDPGLVQIVEQERLTAKAVGYDVGYAEGLDAGYAEGMAKADAERAEMLVRDEAERHQRAQALAALLATIGAQVQTALDRETPTVEDMGYQVAHLAVSLAEEIVGHHLRIDDCAAADAVRRALSHLPRHATVTLYMHPEDVVDIATITDGITDFDIAQVVADTSIERYGAKAVAEHLTVDAQIGVAVERLKKVLRP